MAHTSKVREIRNQMVTIYGENCWMGYTLSKKNPFTFHHIFEQRRGGKDLIENGALLTYYAHQDLNLLDIHAKELYKELNLLFIALNKTKKPPTIEYYREVNKILLCANNIIALSGSCNLNPDYELLGDLMKSAADPKKSHFELLDEYCGKVNGEERKDDGYIKIKGVYIPVTKDKRKDYDEEIEIPIEYRAKTKHKGRYNNRYSFR